MNTYPILYARIGSTVNAPFTEFDKFQSSVFRKKITKFVFGGEGKKFLSGQSQYVFTDSMNQGSFGISGSYGITGIEKVEASVSAYAGNATAECSKDCTLFFNAFITLGIEILDVNHLSIADFINALDRNPKRSFMKVLKNYNALVSKMNEHNLLGAELIQKGDNIDDLYNALKTWSDSVDSFQNSYGDSVVVGIHWGAFGAVQIVLSQGENTSSWNYGMAGNFSYSTIGASVSVKAAYNGSQSKSNSNIKVNVQEFYKGRSITPIIDSIGDLFFDKGVKKGFDEIADMDLANLNTAAKTHLEVPSDLIPSIPTFVEPVEDKEVNESLNNVENLDELSTIEKSKILDDQKEKNKDFSVSDLDKVQSEDEVNKINLDTLTKEAGDKINELISDEKKSVPEMRLYADSENRASNRADNLNENIEEHGFKESIGDDERTEADDPKFGEDFVPLGVVLCHWSDLFPWFVRGFDNRLSNLEGIKEILAWRMMIQDFLALSVIYYSAGNAKLSISSHAPATQMANEFSQKAGILQNKSDDISYASLVTSTYKGLSKWAKTIYDKWAEIGFLRNAELGMGVIDRSLGETEINSLDSTKNYDGPGAVPKPAKSVIIKPCAFDTDNKFKGFSAFSSFIKVLPVILPDDGSVCTFTEDGFLGAFVKSEQRPPSRLGVIGKPYTGFYPDAKVKFNVPPNQNFDFNAVCKVDKDNACLYIENVFHRVYSFYPIPFSAAQGVDHWRGAGSGVRSLNTFEDMGKAIAEIGSSLKSRGSWTFQSEKWKKIKWDSSMGLSELPVEEQYIGITPPAMSVFPRKKSH